MSFTYFASCSATNLPLCLPFSELDPQPAFASSQSFSRSYPVFLFPLQVFCALYLLTFKFIISFLQIQFLIQVFKFFPVSIKKRIQYYNVVKRLISKRHKRTPQTLTLENMNGNLLFLKSFSLSSNKNPWPAQFRFSDLQSLKSKNMKRLASCCIVLLLWSFFVKNFQFSGLLVVFFKEISYGSDVHTLVVAC